MSLKAKAKDLSLKPKVKAKNMPYNFLLVTRTCPQGHTHSANCKIVIINTQTIISKLSVRKVNTLAESTMKLVPSSLLICSQKHLAIHVNLLYTCKRGKELLQLYHHKIKLRAASQQCKSSANVAYQHSLHIHTATNTNILNVSEWFAAFSIQQVQL